MKARRQRMAGDPFTSLERVLLELLCGGDDPHRVPVREQLRSARWGGYEFEDCDCFRLSVAELPPSTRIHHEGGPFSVLEVRRRGECLGLVELWVIDGYLHSVNYMSLADDHDTLPGPAEFDLQLVD
ncbi:MULTISPECIES: hypothetical protein [Micrococcaceae]|uniref:hypothetical protein n=1 Tax=Micrococcaceae TaxID=1268 RepID=UPI0016231708|nr:MULTISPECIES: hypothetical protein [Micrococcaceae]MBB5748708.1 hypothetical protein [Micrococcus sp. TA1]HRO31440.1 hypothetical protein [Citricoccus sp.]HRO94808.1 hypothetical protein [Citricoccus sp.]